jgi:hypothetical protein
MNEGATRGEAHHKRNQDRLKLLTPRKKSYIHCPKVQDWPDSNAQHAPDFGLVHSQQKGKLKMGSLKGGEPKKKAPKKKAAKKKAAKK